MHLFNSLPRTIAQCTVLPKYEIVVVTSEYPAAVQFSERSQYISCLLWHRGRCRNINYYVHVTDLFVDLENVESMLLFIISIGKSWEPKVLFWRHPVRMPRATLRRRVDVSDLATAAYYFPRCRPYSVTFSTNLPSESVTCLAHSGLWSRQSRHLIDIRIPLRPASRWLLLSSSCTLFLSCTCSVPSS